MPQLSIAKVGNSEAVLQVNQEILADSLTKYCKLGKLKNTNLLSQFQRIKYKINVLADPYSF